MHCLTRNTLAAGALKLGGLAAFQAEASVVYVDIPDTVIVNDIFSPATEFDLNGDGNPDFTFGHQATDTATDGQQDAIAIAASDPTFVAVANEAGDPLLIRFGPGDTIDMSAFANANKVGILAVDNFDGVSPGVRGSIGNWYNGGAGTIGYLGFAMTGLAGDNPGDFHFGWFRVGVGPYDNSTSSLAITAYATPTSRSPVSASRSRSRRAGRCSRWVAPRSRRAAVVSRPKRPDRTKAPAAGKQGLPAVFRSGPGRALRPHPASRSHACPPVRESGFTSDQRLDCGAGAG